MHRICSMIGYLSNSWASYYKTKPKATFKEFVYSIDVYVTNKNAMSMIVT